MDRRTFHPGRSSAIGGTLHCHEADFDLRLGPGRSSPDCLRSQAFSCSHRGAPLRKTLLRRRLFLEARDNMSSRPSADIQLTIDGRSLTVPAGTTIFDAARSNGIPIPTLCHQQNENPVGVCRVCVVDVGQRVYAASCIRQVEPGMTVKTSSPPVEAARHTLI